MLFSSKKAVKEMAELIWSERAILDLESIYDYIAQDSALYARYTVQNIFKSRGRELSAWRVFNLFI